YFRHDLHFVYSVVASVKPNKPASLHAGLKHPVARVPVINPVLVHDKFHHPAKSFQFYLMPVCAYCTVLHQIGWTEFHEQKEMSHESYDSNVAHDKHLVIENVAVLKIDLRPKVLFLLWTF